VPRKLDPLFRKLCVEEGKNPLQTAANDSDSKNGREILRTILCL